MKTRQLAGFVLSLVVALPGAWAETTTNAPTPAQYALALLKPVTDRLSAAATFRFKAHGMVEVPSPTGQLINYFSISEVTVGRPNKLVVKRTGDGRAFDLYCDGKTFTGVDEEHGFYAQMNAAPTFDEMIPQVMEKSGIVFPFADLLYHDVYGAVTKDLTHAYWVGKSTVDGIDCEHLAFAGPGVEWQIWIGPEKNPLPRRLAVTFLKMDRQPQFMVNFTDWDLTPSVSPKMFEAKLPAGAKQIAFKPIKPAP